MPSSIEPVPPSPAFMVLGVQKGGTSWLHNVLKQVPDICGSSPKETKFFAAGWKSFYHQLPSDKLRTRYLSHWPKPDGRLFFEASPGYIVYRETALRVQRYFPQTRFVVTLRDPSARAYSLFNMWTRGGRVTGTFRDFYTPILDELDVLRTRFKTESDWFDVVRSARPRTALSHGLYYFQLEKWLELFQIDQFFFLTTKQLRDRETMRRLIVHVGGEADWADQLDLTAENANAHDGAPISPEDKAELDKFFMPYNHLLYELLGVRELIW